MTPEEKIAQLRDPVEIARRMTKPQARFLLRWYHRYPTMPAHWDGNDRRIAVRLAQKEVLRQDPAPEWMGRRFEFTPLGLKVGAQLERLEAGL